MNNFKAQELAGFLAELNIPSKVVKADEPDIEDDSVTFPDHPWLHVQVGELTGMLCTVQEFSDDEGGHFFVFGAERQNYDDVICDVVDILAAGFDDQNAKYADDDDANDIYRVEQLPTDHTSSYVVTNSENDDQELFDIESEALDYACSKNEQLDPYDAEWRDQDPLVDADDESEMTAQQRIEYCEQIIKDKPKTTAARNARYLIDSINEEQSYLDSADDCVVVQERLKKLLDA